mmetsp:Transcript_23254/g.41239  ORF Transcript_23254/g.41239 Transcript_23254/m.41239 type:complete len:114 (+) Transcript_23254:131-472(+)
MVNDWNWKRTSSPMHIQGYQVLNQAPNYHCVTRDKYSLVVLFSNVDFRTLLVDHHVFVEQINNTQAAQRKKPGNCGGLMSCCKPIATLTNTIQLVYNVMERKDSIEISIKIVP